MKLSKMSKKMVVNTMSGEVLGYVRDLELDLNSYQVQHFIVEEQPSFFEKIFPWIFKRKTTQLFCESVESIGNDVILVRLKNK